MPLDVSDHPVIHHAQFAQRAYVPEAASVLPEDDAERPVSAEPFGSRTTGSSQGRALEQSTRPTMREVHRADVLKARAQVVVMQGTVVLPGIQADPPGASRGR